MAERRQHPLGIGMWLVIVSKALIALLLLVSFVLLLIAGKEEPTYAAAKWITVLFKGNPPGIVIGFAVSKAATLTTAKVYILAGATFLYGFLESVEATGLAFRKLWAEYLTIAVTASLIPFEVFELAKELTAVKAATLAMNAAILVYLVVRRIREHRQPSRQPWQLRLA